GAGVLAARGTAADDRHHRRPLRSPRARPGGPPARAVADPGRHRRARGARTLREARRVRPLAARAGGATRRRRGVHPRRRAGAGRGRSLGFRPLPRHLTALRWAGVPSWAPRSIAIATDLDVLPARSIVRRRVGYTVVRSPSNPAHYWGNFLVFDD